MEAKNEAPAFWLLFASKSNEGKRFEGCPSGDKIKDLLFNLILFLGLQSEYFFHTELLMNLINLNLCLRKNDLL
jgi:hypothetical protein